MSTNVFNEADDHSRTIIHIDLDCFYAQVEMIKDPSLRDVPLGIQQKNIVVTSNYKAREYGIQKCMLVKEAKELCPKLVLVKGEDLKDYRKTSYELTNLLQTYTNLVERLGLDENFMDVSNIVKERLKRQNQGIKVVGNIFGNTSEMCQCGCEERLKMGSIIAGEIREKIRNTLQLTSCAGIGHNKLLSKIVGSKHKPNQQTVVFPSSSLELVNSLNSVEKIPGIGRVTSDLLSSLHIKMITDLQNAHFSMLSKLFDVDKVKLLIKLSNGIDNSLVKQSGKPLSIGLEDSCRSISAEKEVREKLKELLNRLLLLVHSDGRLPRCIKLTLRKLDKNTKISHRESKQSNIQPNIFQMSQNTEQKLLDVIMQLFRKMVDINKPFHLTLLGLSFTKFNEPPRSKNSVAAFLRRDLEVQSVTSIENINTTKISPDCTPSTSRNGEFSESESEPSPKRTRVHTPLIAKRRFLTELDCDSPSKLRVAELRLNSTEKNDNSQNISCPPTANESVFRELPLEMQKEIWEDYKRKREPGLNLCVSQAKKSRTNTLLNYFVKH